MQNNEAMIKKLDALIAIQEETGFDRDRDKKIFLDTVALRDRLLGRDLHRVNKNTFIEYKWVGDKKLITWFRDNPGILDIKDADKYDGNKLRSLKALYTRTEGKSKIMDWLEEVQQEIEDD